MKTRYKILIVGGLILLALLVVLPLSYLIYKSPAVGGAIAVIPVKGFITLEECSQGIFSQGECASVPEIKQQLNDANEDWTVKAILLDIDSGGGSVVASRELMRAIADSEKPVISWIGEAGASGAYYAASASDHIMADRDSITGSIGVISSFIHYYGLMDKIGVNVTVIKAGESKDVGSPYREMSDEEREEFGEMLDGIYVDFVRDVAINRGLSLEYAQNISGGKIYLGKEALEIGLIDSLGGFEDAISAAGQLGGIEGEPKVKYPESSGGFSLMVDRVSTNVGYGFGKALL